MKFVINTLFLCAFFLGLHPLRAEPTEPKMKSSPEAIKSAATTFGVDRLLRETRNKDKHFPSLGRLLIDVTPNSFAEREGITPGSVFLPVGRFSASHPAGINTNEASDTLQQEDYNITYVTKDHQLKKGTSPPGPIGVKTMPYRNVAFWYLHHGQRREAWDSFILTAIITQGHDISLAESCWAMARKSGYKPDKLLHWSMAFLLAAQENYQGCGESIKAFGTIKRPEQDSDFPLQSTDWVELGLRCGNMTCIKQALECFPDEHLNFTTASAQNLVDLAETNPMGEKSPSQLAETMKHRSFLRNAKDTGPTGKTPPMLAKLHRMAAAVDDSPPYQFDPILASATLDHYVLHSMVPNEIEHPNIDLRLEFRMQPQPEDPKSHKNFIRGFTFGIIHSMRDQPEYSKNIMVANVSVDRMGDISTGAWSISHSNCRNANSTTPVWQGRHNCEDEFHTMTTPPFAQDDNLYHTLRIVRMGFWVETLVDNKRIALMPVPADHDNPYISLKVIGSKTWIRSLRAEFID